MKDSFQFLKILKWILKLKLSEGKEFSFYFFCWTVRNLVTKKSPFLFFFYAFILLEGSKSLEINCTNWYLNTLLQLKKNIIFLKDREERTLTRGRQPSGWERAWSIFGKWNVPRVRQKMRQDPYQAGEITDSQTLKGGQRSTHNRMPRLENVCRNANSDASRLESQKITLILWWKINCVGNETEAWGASVVRCCKGLRCPTPVILVGLEGRR